MKLVALDLGSNMALAHNGFDDVVVTDHREFKGTRPVRFLAQLQWLDQRFGEIAKGCPDIKGLVYERPFDRGQDAKRCGWGTAGIVEALAEKHGWAVMDLATPTIKAFALGKVTRKKMSRSERAKNNTAEKLSMTAAAINMGYLGCNEHEADAYCLLQCALADAIVTPAKTPKPKTEKTNGNRKAVRRRPR